MVNNVSFTCLVNWIYCELFSCEYNVTVIDYDLGIKKILKMKRFGRRMFKAIGLISNNGETNEYSTTVTSPNSSFSKKKLNMCSGCAKSDYLKEETHK